MTPGARLAAAGEILTEVVGSKAAADRTIAAWGKAHRFAGSKDRAAIGERVYGVLRRLNECSHAMGSDAARALVLGSLKVIDGLGVEQIDALCADGTHAMGALSGSEHEALAATRAPGASWISLNYPQWLHDELAGAFGDELTAEVEALNGRAPLDLRVNTLKARRADVVGELAAMSLSAVPCKRAATGIRLAAGTDAKIMQMACYLEGRVEVQDESSQLAIELAGARAGQIVVDLAAGGGGKALGLVASMGNKGRLLVCDIGSERLERMKPRAERSGASIIEYSGNPYAPDLKERLAGGADLVFVDAPCSSTGTWRRNPEAKWTLTPERLSGYRAAQVELLERAVLLCSPRGRVIYAVCSVLACEGRQQIEAICARVSGWRLARSLFLTPAQDGTDGFFAAELLQGAA